jgi:uncharacterized membrane protein
MSCTQEIIYDSIGVINTVCNTVADSIVTNDALIKSQQLYNDSFINIQNSFSNFVFGISVISAILATITMVLVVVNFLSANKLRNESKKELEKIKNFEKKLEKQKNEFEEIKKKFEVLEKKSEDKIKELTATQENSFYRFLKGKFPSCSNVYMEINIKSKTFKKTEKGLENCEFKYCKITDSFDERKFKIAISNFTLYIPYSKLREWWPDDWQPDRKVNLELNMAIVLHPDEKLELEDL